MQRLLLAAAAIVLLGGCGSASSAAPTQLLQPLAAGEPLRDRAAGPRTGHVAWRRELEGPVVPGPVQGPDGTVYAASNAGVLHAVDPATGRDRWHFDGGTSYGSDLSTSAVAVGTTRLLWPGPSNTLYLLRADTGMVLDRTRLVGQPLTPAVRGSHVAVQDSSGTLTGLRLGSRDSTLRRVWRRHLGPGSYSSPAVGSGGTVYAAAGAALFAIEDGRVAWTVRTGGTIEVSPAVAADGTVTVGSNDRHQYGVRPDGRVAWRHDLGDLTYSSAATTPDGLIYLGDHRGLVTGLAAADGRVRFRVLGQGRTAVEHNVGVWTRPVVDADHAVYFGTHPGHVFGFAADGRQLLDADLGGVVDAYPLLTTDGLLIAGSESGALVAFG